MTVNDPFIQIKHAQPKYINDYLLITLKVSKHNQTFEAELPIEII